MKQKPLASGFLFLSIITENALRDFQGAHNLTPDGIFGKQTASYVDTNCTNLKKRGEDIGEETQEGVEEQKGDEKQDDKENLGEKIGDFLIDLWDGIGNWFNQLFGVNDNNAIVTPVQESENEKEEEKENEFITKEMLRQAFNLNVDGRIVSELNRLFPVYEITTKERLAHFLSQVAHESQFKIVEENGNYSLSFLKKFYSKTRYPKFYTNWEYYKGNRERILNYLYRNRLGNGDEESGDGFRYRGRSLIQLTGKANYQSYTNDWNSKNEDDIVNFVENPDLLLRIKYGVGSAFYFWQSRNFNQFADLATEDSIREVTKKINGGSIGLEDRRRKFYSIYQLLTNA